MRPFFPTTKKEKKSKGKNTHTNKNSFPMHPLLYLPPQTVSALTLPPLLLRPTLHSLRGRSGCGKTTLMRGIHRLINHGSICEIDHHDDTIQGTPNKPRLQRGEEDFLSSEEEEECRSVEDATGWETDEIIKKTAEYTLGSPSRLRNEKSFFDNYLSSISSSSPSDSVKSQDATISGYVTLPNLVSVYITDTSVNPRSSPFASRGVSDCYVDAIFDAAGFDVVRGEWRDDVDRDGTVLLLDEVLRTERNGVIGGRVVRKVMEGVEGRNVAVVWMEHGFDVGGVCWDFFGGNVKVC